MLFTAIRHLPTEWNQKTWLQGRRDIEICPPSAHLQKDIFNNQQLLKNQSPFDLVIASTLKRTQQTAVLYGYQAEPEPLLDELDFGPFEGSPKEKLVEKYQDEWFENPSSLILGESVANLEERIEVLLNKYQYFSNVLVFGHGSWIRAMMSYWKYGHINQMNKMKMENNQCITLEFLTVV